MCEMTILLEEGKEEQERNSKGNEWLINQSIDRTWKSTYINRGRERNSVTFIHDLVFSLSTRQKIFEL